MVVDTDPYVTKTQAVLGLTLSGLALFGFYQLCSSAEPEKTNPTVRLLLPPILLSRWFPVSNSHF